MENVKTLLSGKMQDRKWFEIHLLIRMYIYVIHGKNSNASNFGYLSVTDLRITLIFSFELFCHLNYLQ